MLLILLIFSKKAYSNYLMMAFFPVCLTAATAGQSRPILAITLFSIFGGLAVLEPSLWFRWLHQSELAVAWSASAERDKVLAFTTVELFMIAFYVRYALQAYRLAAASKTPDDSPRV